MKSPKIQPKLKKKANRVLVARAKSTRATNLGSYAAAYIRLPPPPKPLIECPPINHPRGKDGAWGH